MEMDYANDYSYDAGWFFSAGAIGLELGAYFGGGHYAKKYAGMSKRVPSGLSFSQNDINVSSVSSYGQRTRTGSLLGNRGGEVRKRFSSQATYARKAKYFAGLKKAGAHLGYVSLAAVGFSIFDAIVGSTGLYGKKRVYNPAGSSMEAPYENAFFDSRAAFTQRQRALMVIHNSQLSNRAAFGNEATFMHN